MVISANEIDGALLQLFAVGHPCGNIQRITNDSNNYYSLSIAGNSRQMIAVNGNREANVYVLPGGEMEREAPLTSGIGKEAGLEGVCWTRDGRVVYTGGPRGKRDLIIAGVDGGSATTLTNENGNNVTPTVTADDRFIVFSSNRSGDYCIWRMGLDGSNPTQVTVSNGRNHLRPHCSPDGRWVVYEEREQGPVLLYKVPIDPDSGVPPQKLSDGSYSRPAISPDGKWIACVEGVEGKGLAILPFNGGEPVKTVDLGATIKSPVLLWEPKGDAILFLRTDGENSFWQWPWRAKPPFRKKGFSSEDIYFFNQARNGDLVLSKGGEHFELSLFPDF
jgi:tricorn protease-like protein